MRLARCALGLSKRCILVAVTVAVLTSPAWAGIKVGNLDPLSGEKMRLKEAGWAGTFGPNLPESSLPDKVELQRAANQLVGSSAGYLPKEIAAKVSKEMKDEIARIAREAFEQAILEERSITKMGRTGSLRYKVGALRYYGDTYRRGEKVSSGGLAPFIALMSSGQARALKAKITVYGMPAEAEIFFDGEPTTQKGGQRDYFTPPLKVGTIYQYEVVARWQENGKEVKRSRQVSLTGGDAVSVDFYNHKRWINCKWTRYTGKRKAAETCSCAYSPDRKTVLKVLETGADTPKAVRLYDAATDKPLGPKIVLLQTIPVKDPSTGKPLVPKLTSHGERVVALAVAPDGKTIATAISLPKDDTIVEVWDATTGDRVGSYMGTRLREIFDLTFFQNGKFVLIVALPKEGE
jgi:uncharacterized protein (TIGR03000 family)